MSSNTCDTVLSPGRVRRFVNRCNDIPDYYQSEDAKATAPVLSAKRGNACLCKHGAGRDSHKCYPLAKNDPINDTTKQAWAKNVCYLLSTGCAQENINIPMLISPITYI